MIIITGAAGFIGSALVWALNKQGRTDLLLVDEVDHDEKEHNVGHLQYERLIGVKDFRQQLLAGDFNAADIEAILHMGACSDTTENNWEYLLDNNIEYSQDVIRWCAGKGVRCLYASSAATYGDGSWGFGDDHNLFDQLTPLNLYGKSKLTVDTWARDGGYLERVAGLRYFNVYGPNEQHKEHMRSVMAKKFPQVQQGYIELFKSRHPDYKDGEQERDFLYIKDAVAMTLFFLEQPEVVGVYNIGTGQARTWNDVAAALFAAAGKPADIRYVELPERLADQYQYHTEADITKLKTAGFNTPLGSLEEGIKDYVQNYLLPHKHLGEEGKALGPSSSRGQADL